MIVFNEQQCQEVNSFIIDILNNKINLNKDITNGGPCAEFVGVVLNKISGRVVKQNCLPTYANMKNYQLIDSFDKFSTLPAGTILRVWENDHFIHTTIKLTDNRICGINGADLLCQHIVKIQEDDFIYEHFAYRCIYYYAALLYVTAKDLFNVLKSLYHKKNNQLNIDKILLYEKYIAAKSKWEKASNQSNPLHRILIPDEVLYKNGISELCREIDSLYRSKSVYKIEEIDRIITKYQMNQLPKQYWDYVYRKISLFCTDLYALKDNEMILIQNYK